jgi:uncharacterized repeat protein (TIGR01451 family)
VSQTDNADPVGAGSDVTYTITVSNSGPDNATGVLVKDQLPPSASFVSASGGTCSHASGVVNCALNDIAAGGQRELTVRATTTTPGTITNLVTATARQSEASTSDNVLVPHATLVVSPRADDTTAPSVMTPWFAFANPFPLDVNLPALNRVRWSASDASGICRYEFKQSVDGDAFAPVALAAPTATSIDREHAFGRRYRYRLVRPDCSGAMKRRRSS